MTRLCAASASFCGVRGIAGGREPRRRALPLAKFLPAPRGGDGDGGQDRVSGGSLEEAARVCGFLIHNSFFFLSRCWEYRRSPPW